MSEAPQTRFGIQRIYIKNSSFEAPNSPDVFRTQWQPKIKIDLNTKAQALGEDAFEVVLRLTVTANLEEKVAFLAEIEQAAIVTVAGFEAEQQNQMLGAYIPSVLFPYAREAIDAMVVKGSFPAVMLAPVNFDVLYQQNLQKNAEAATAH